MSLTYDGQGDRLRSDEQAGPTPVPQNDAQDLAAFSVGWPSTPSAGQL